MLRALGGDEPAVPESAFVSEMAYLVGDVALGEHSSVWPFVCVRGDHGPTTVGAETNVQDHAMLHEADLGERVTVGHNVVVDGASVGDGSLVGISSAVLSGASVGSNAVVAAGAVVREGQAVPDGHLAYGVPAETKPLSEELRASIDAYCEAYLGLSEEYREEGGLGVR